MQYLKHSLSLNNFCICLVPSSVLNVSYENISSTSILVNWVPPLNPNGRITHYTVYGLKLHSYQALNWFTNSTSKLITGRVTNSSAELSAAIISVIIIMIQI